MTNNSTRLRLRIFATLVFTFAVAAASTWTLASATAHETTPTIATPTIIAPAPAQPNIDAGGFFATDKAQRGRAIQAAVVLDVPRGFHINANRPLGKYAVATVVRVEAPAGVRVSPVTYPRSIVRRFKFSDEQLAVYEGLVPMRFNVTVPANYNGDSLNMRARVKFQSCNDDVCFPPATRDIALNIPVVNSNEQVRRVNTKLFGDGGRRK